MRKLKIFALALTVLLAAGCATGPKFSTVANGLPAVPEGKARIFFYRTAVIGAGIQPDIKVNGLVVGSSVPLGVFYVDRNPGNIVVTTTSEVEKRLTFTVGAGEIRYVRCDVGLGVLVYRIIPELVGDHEAKREMADLSYTGFAAAGMGVPADAIRGTAPAAAAPPSAAAAAGSTSPSAPPAQGASYRYLWSDLKYGRKQQEFVVRVTAASGASVSEQWDNSPTLSVVAANELGFISRRVGGDAAFIELSPYMPAAKMAQAQEAIAQLKFAEVFDIEGAEAEWDQAEAPAGTFRALRVTLRGARKSNYVGGAAVSTVPKNFVYTAWYAPELKRLVMLRHQIWSGSGALITDEQVALVEYREK
jgi:hypothetical protein